MRLLILSILSVCLAAEEAKLPPDAQAAIDKAEKSISVAQAKADAEILKVRQELVKALTKAQESATKKGDLNSAMAIKAQIDELAKLTQAALLDPKAGAQQDADEKLLEGVWQVQKSGWRTTLSIQGTGAVTAGDGTSGTWEIKDGSFTIKWTGLQNRWEAFTLPVQTKKSWVGDSWNLGKKTISITKVSE